MQFDMGSRTVTVRRSGEEGNKHVVEGLSSPDLTLGEWRAILQSELFGLGPDVGKWAPTGRALLSYFARRQDSGAFSDPFRNSAQQQEWDKQTCASWLLGLDWTIAQEWQVVREKEASLKSLRKAAREGILAETIGTVAELRTKLAVAESDAENAKLAAANFQVIDRYRDLEAEASQATRRMQRLADDNAIDRELADDLAMTLQREAPPDREALVRLYRAAGVELPAAALQQYADVERFHDSVIANRSAYLRQELGEAQSRVSARERERSLLGNRLSEIMSTLHQGGALDQFVALQADVGRLEGTAQALRQRYESAEEIESGLAKADIDRRQLLVRLQEDHRSREAPLLYAIATFEGLSRELYEERAGSLQVKAGLNGPEFDIQIPSGRSKGIHNMQVWCFDMTCAVLCARRSVGPRFLVHDSHLFDGVDERQVATALVSGARLAKELGFQYVVTMNTDDIPAEFPDGFTFEEFVRSPRLTDATEDGGLFGVRF